MEILGNSWEIRPEENGRYGTRIREVRTEFDFPENGIVDLFDSCRGFRDLDPENVPRYVLDAFGFDMSVCPEKKEQRNMFASLCRENFGVLSSSGNCGFQMGKRGSGRIMVRSRNVNMLLLARIMATVLKKHDSDTTVVIESMYIDEPGPFCKVPEGSVVFGGEAWAVCAGMIERIDTKTVGETMGMGLANRLRDMRREAAERSPSPGM